MQLTAGWILLLSCQMTESARCSAFGVQRSVFRVQGLTFSVRGAGPSGGPLKALYVSHRSYGPEWPRKHSPGFTLG
jgi:hypothetical protein